MAIGIDLNVLKNNLNKLEKKETNTNKLINISVENYQFTNNEETNIYLQKKSKELVNLIGNSNLYLGTIFLEVQEYLSNLQEEDTTYCKWLEFNGFNRMSALRYKKRALIFRELTRQKAKEIIALVPQRIIDELSKEECFEKNKAEIEEINNINDLENIIQIFKKKIEQKEQIEEETQTTKQSKKIYLKLVNEIKKNNIVAAKKEVKNLKDIVKELEKFIEEKEVEKELENNLTIFNN